MTWPFIVVDQNRLRNADLVVVGRKVTDTCRDEIEMGLACADVIEHGATTLLLAIAPGAMGGLVSGMASMGLDWLAFGGLDAAISG